MATDLPEPDSPTIASTSPRIDRQRTPSTARNGAVPGGEFDGEIADVERAAPSASPQLRIERIAQAVADQIDGEHGDQDGEAGKRHDPGAERRNSRAEASIVPHSGVGGCAPRPRKPSAAASRMAFETPSVACTMSGARQLGSTVEHRGGAARRRRRGRRSHSPCSVRRAPRRAPGAHSAAGRRW